MLLYENVALIDHGLLRPLRLKCLLRGLFCLCVHWVFLWLQIQFHNFHNYRNMCQSTNVASSASMVKGYLTMAEKSTEYATDHEWRRSRPGKVCQDHPDALGEVPWERAVWSFSDPTPGWRVCTTTSPSRPSSSVSSALVFLKVGTHCSTISEGRATDMWTRVRP